MTTLAPRSTAPIPAAACPPASTNEVGRADHAADVARLADLLELAARGHPFEPRALESLRAAATATTGRLAAAGRLPRGLVVRPTDPAVVLVRALAVAVRRLDLG